MHLDRALIGPSARRASIHFPMRIECRPSAGVPKSSLGTSEDEGYRVFVQHYATYPVHAQSRGANSPVGAMFELARTERHAFSASGTLDLETLRFVGPIPARRVSG